MCPSVLYLFLTCLTPHNFTCQSYEIQYLFFQEEQEHGNKQRHLQGMIQFDNRKSSKQVFKLFEALGINDIHVEKARVVNALYEYVHKKLTRVENGICIEEGNFVGSGGSKQKEDADGAPIVRYADVIEYFEEGLDPNKIIRALGPNVLKINFRNVYREVRAQKQADDKDNRINAAEDWWKDDSYEWQKKARSILEEWSEEENDRQIMVIYDPTGSNGKTVFCKQFQDANPDKVAYIKKSKLNDMSYLLKDYEDLDYCLIDYTRDDEKYGSPKFVESLKDGIVQSNKYQSEIRRFSNVQVAVMTNKQLNWSTLTKDRWAVYEMKRNSSGTPYIEKWSEEQFKDALYESMDQEPRGEKRPIELVTGNDESYINSFHYFQKARNQRGTMIYSHGH